MKPRSCTAVRLGKRLVLLASLVAAAAFGAAAGLFLRSAATAHFVPGFHTGMYSFSGPDCIDSVDPVNVRFNGTDATAKRVQAHADHHGVLGGIFPEAWDSHGSPFATGAQYYWDHDSCELQDRESASNNGFLGLLPQARYHMRYNEADIDGVPDIDPAVGGYYTLATAHHEHVVLCAQTLIDMPWPIPDFLVTLPSHAVEAGQPSGFDMARNRLETLWVSYGGHGTPALKEYWNNIDPQRQCNDDLAASDGYVLYVDIPQQGGSVGGKAFLGF